MAQAIVNRNFPTFLWARRPQSLEPYLARVTVAATPAELASSSDVIGICVLGDADVEEVVLGPDGIHEGVRPGSVVVIHSTVHPDTCRRVGRSLSRTGADVLDAPVSGGGAAAEAARLLVMVGGELHALERARPILTAFGDPIVHLGGLGAGQTAKLINNLLFTDHLALAHRAVEVGSALGLDPDALVRTLQHGSGRSFALGIYGGRRGTVADGETPTAKMTALLAKDVSLVSDLLAARQVPGDLLIEVARAGLRAITG